jgi:hypothetical protein
MVRMDVSLVMTRLSMKPASSVATIPKVANFETEITRGDRFGGDLRCSGATLQSSVMRGGARALTAGVARLS